GLIVWPFLPLVTNHLDTLLDIILPVSLRQFILPSTILMAAGLATMPTEFSKYMTSHLYIFVIGPRGKEITVHSGPLANLSTPLNNLINGKMVEANHRRAVWSDVKEETFFRLCEYAYVRDYTPPTSYLGITRQARPTEDRPEPVGTEKLAIATPKTSNMVNANVTDTRMFSLSGPNPRRQNPVTYDVFNGHRLPCYERDIRTAHLHNILAVFESELKPKLERSSAMPKYNPVGNHEPGENFSPVFLGHTELYILADKYDITPLKDLVLYKLVRTLSLFNVCQSNVGNVTEWIRLAYQKTLPQDPLRKLVIAYIVSHLGQFGGNEGFKELLDEGGDFVIDFWDKIWNN
ncbi:hypothetical protein BO94DRAFT_617188, partial [Aspergillus sclerotioniger CBS 115572]